LLVVGDASLIKASIEQGTSEVGASRGNLRMRGVAKGVGPGRPLCERKKKGDGRCEDGSTLRGRGRQMATLKRERGVKLKIENERALSLGWG
jgi:hypothetical protein